MNTKRRKSDSIRNESSSFKIRRSSSPKKQIRSKATNNMYVGIDLHKKFLLVVVMDNDGKILQNKKVDNTHQSIKKHFADIPLYASIVIESSSVWYDTYRFLTDKLGYKVTLSNLYLTKAIAASKKKTGKIDVKMLADLLCGGYIVTCYVPNKKIVKQCQLVRYRKKLVQWRTAIKNSIHGILLQEGIRIPGVTFVITYNNKLKALGNYRIDGFYDR